uniref:Tr-type G domain-containing protein n=1 Tax=Meloidogyne incognita TaxID=6306 RepID=A0A914MH88_MELIC
MVSNSDRQLCVAFDESPPSMVRNVCIIAHVDHGKTTLADYLVSANGIISARLAGKLRYMDSREDEQIRGITMKSSVITLYYEPLLINLIDSPGHVDFCNEVSSAVNLADVGILLVDVVEGVCAQTESLIRLALIKKLDIILVLNKIDRLIVELKMSETEAHKHLQQLIEFMNACLSKAIQGQLFEEDWKIFDQVEARMHFDPSKGNVLFASALYGYAFAIEDFAELWAKRLIARQTWQSEEKNKNKRMDVKTEITELRIQLAQHLFSRDHYFSTKTSKICPGAEQKDKKTMFDQFVLEPLWEVHKCALLDKTVDKLSQIASKLSLPSLKSRRGDEAFPELMRNWLPLSSAIVRACARSCSAQNAYKMPQNDSLSDWNRIRDLFVQNDGDVGTLVDKTQLATPLPYTANCLSKCDPKDPLVLGFVAKAFAASDQVQIQRRISLCRVMCGTLGKGDQIFVFKSSQNVKITQTAQSRHNLEENDCWREFTVTGLFILFGRDLLEVEHIPCGRICGVEVNGGEWIGGSLFSNRQLSPSEIPHMEGAKQLGKFADPIVRVTIKPAISGPAEFAELRAALRQLAVLDSAVSIVEQKENEFLMLTAGEVHLQKCIEDLNSLGQTDLVVSEPIVPFLETLVVPDQRLSHAKILTDHLTECFMPQFGLRIRLRAVPLTGQEPETNKLFELMERNSQLIDSFKESISNAQHRSKIEAFRLELAEQASISLPKLRGSWWAKKPSIQIRQLFTENILSFGPTKARLNILFNNNALPFYNNEDNESNKMNKDSERKEGNTAYIREANLSPLEQALVGGFHIAMAQGPLCDEPMQAIGIIIEDWILEDKTERNNVEIENAKNEEETRNLVEDDDENDRRIIGVEGTSKEIDEREEENLQKCDNLIINCDTPSTSKINEEKNEEKINLEKRYKQLYMNAQLHGQLISAMRQTCKAALKKHVGALRLVAAMYECKVQTPEQMLGKVQAVLSNKRAKVYSEEINEISGLFEISAHLPVIESFSFCDQLRKRSSGKASAQLEFSGWQLIEEDPFWEPSTEEEMEEFGRPSVQIQNQARQYMDAVRRRKGLPTEDVIVVCAEKQRNLKRNK